MPIINFQKSLIRLSRGKMSKLKSALGDFFQCGLWMGGGGATGGVRREGVGGRGGGFYLRWRCSSDDVADGAGSVSAAVRRRLSLSVHGAGAALPLFDAV